MKISVIVTVYNIEPYLPAALRSIQEQSFQELEIILVDDGSVDGSGRICDEFAASDPRIKVIHQSNRGVSAARNAGLDAITGEYFTFVDGDDTIDADMYEQMLELMLEKEADLVICNYKEITGNLVADSSTSRITVWEGREALRAFIEEEDEYRIQNAPWNKLCRTELVRDIRLPEGKIFEDIVYATKLIAASKRTVYTNRAYYNYVTNRGTSIMNSNKTGRILTDQIPAYEEKGKFLREIGEEDLYQIHQLFFLKRMLLHYRQAKKDRPQGWKDFTQSIRRLVRRQADFSLFQGRSGWKGEQLRLRLFCLSPLLYEGFNCLNESLLIPIRQRKSFAGKKGIIICLSGGLGNQMFQYALYLHYQSQGVPVKIDDVTEYKKEKKRIPQLSLFGINYTRASREEVVHWTDSYMDLPSRIRRKLTGRKTRWVMDPYHYDGEIAGMQDAYLYGWWQSEKYFKEIEGKVREAFAFPPQALERIRQGNRQVLEEITRTESVGVHIRRGDYLEAEEVYGGICTPEYYEKAMNLLRRERPGCRFFLFSNEPDWVKENMAAEDVTVVEGNDESSGFSDLYLMSRCRHNIIANSSFSWWGAWLNENPNKLVVAPAKWLNNHETPDIHWQGMLVI